VTSPLDPEDLRLAVYQGFAADGRAPAVDALAGLLRADQATVTAGLRDLADARHLVITEQYRILMAHPFAAIPLGFAVMGQRTLWWGGTTWCAPAATSGCSAIAAAWPRGWPALGSSPATSWTSRRSGGWLAAGTPAASIAATFAATPVRPGSISARRDWTEHSGAFSPAASAPAPRAGFRRPSARAPCHARAPGRRCPER
jgi:hypothetical protein